MLKITAGLAFTVLLHQLAGTAAPILKRQNSKSAGYSHLLSGANAPPEVQILFPPANVTFHVTARVRVRAAASDSDGSIKEVRFYVGTNLFGVATNTPYEAVSEVSGRSSETLQVF